MIKLHFQWTCSEFVSGVKYFNPETIYYIVTSLYTKTKVFGVLSLYHIKA